jgi:hypothetical protein
VKTAKYGAKQVIFRQTTPLESTENPAKQTDNIMARKRLSQKGLR